MVRERAAGVTTMTLTGGRRQASAAATAVPEGKNVARAKDARRRTLPYTFCIAGTQKAATTSLSGLLNKHPNVRRAPQKEMHFFDREDRDWADPDYSDVQRAARPGHLALGDGTPLYMWWPQALHRIRAYNPDMRFVVTFRDPIDRLFSQWAMNVARWPAIALDWPEFLTTFAPDRLEDRIPDGASRQFYRIHSGVVRGYYGQQLERGYEMFGREQFHPVEFGAFLADHRSHLDALAGFLGLPPYQAYPDLPHRMRGTETVAGTAPSVRDIEMLVERYRDDFETFKELSGLDVATWSLQRLLDGTLEPADLADRFARRVSTPGGPG